MKYEDLLAVPFKWGGRDKSGMDCWGVVVECCRRAGTPIADPFISLSGSISEDEAMRVRLKKINAREAGSPAVGRILYCTAGKLSHVGYIAERGKLVHAVEGKGVRVSPLACFPNARFFEVTDEEPDDCNAL